MSKKRKAVNSSSITKRAKKCIKTAITFKPVDDTLVTIQTQILTHIKHPPTHEIKNYLDDSEQWIQFLAQPRVIKEFDKWWSSNKFKTNYESVCKIMPNAVTTAKERVNNKQLQITNAFRLANFYFQNHMPIKVEINATCPREYKSARITAISKSKGIEVQFDHYKVWLKRERYCFQSPSKSKSLVNDCYWMGSDTRLYKISDQLDWLAFPQICHSLILQFLNDF